MREDYSLLSRYELRVEILEDESKDDMQKQINNFLRGKESRLIKDLDLELDIITNNNSEEHKYVVMIKYLSETK